MHQTLIQGSSGYLTDITLKLKSTVVRRHRILPGILRVPKLYPRHPKKPCRINTIPALPVFLQKLYCQNCINYQKFINNQECPKTSHLFFACDRANWNTILSLTYSKQGTSRVTNAYGLTLILNTVYTGINPWFPLISIQVYRILDYLMVCREIRPSFNGIPVYYRVTS